MKNLFKFGFLGLALTFIIAACNEPAAQDEAQDVEINTQQDVIIEADSADTIIIEEVEADAAEVN
jgi:hypothetical protein